MTERLDCDQPAHPILRAGLQVLHSVGRDDLVERLTPLFQELALHGARTIEYARLLMLYLIHASSQEMGDFQRVLAPSYPRVQEELMPTLAQTWLEQGRLVGKSEGREVGFVDGRLREAVKWSFEMIDEDAAVALRSDV